MLYSQKINRQDKFGGLEIREIGDGPSHLNYNQEVKYKIGEK